MVGGLGAVGAHLEDIGDRAAAEAFAEDGFELGLQAADIVGELDDGLEEAVVERADFDGVVGAVAFGGGVAETGHADNHAGSRSV